MKQAYLSGLFGIGLVASACDRPATAGADTQARGAAAGTSLAISVGASGYSPDSVRAPAGMPARLVFTRTTDEGCGQQLVFPVLGIRRDLPLNQAVEVDITMPASGSVAFTCGMDMYRGSVLAE